MYSKYRFAMKIYLTVGSFKNTDLSGFLFPVSIITNPQAKENL